MKKISTLLLSMFMLLTICTYSADAKWFSKKEAPVVEQAVDAAVSDVNEAAADVQETTVEAVVEETQEAAAEVKEEVNAAVDEAEAVVEQAVTETETQVEEAAAAVEEEVTEADATAQEAIDAAAGEVPVSNLTSVIPDVAADYWANMEINAVVKENIMPLFDDGTFAPEVVVRRIDFAKWVLNALENSTFRITVQNNFSDVDENTEGYEAILRNDQLGLIYGYPDGTFQPERVITKAETNSIMSHITKDVVDGESVLGGYTDTDDIPAWAVQTYEKTVRYGLFVNHPDQAEFLPNKELNRAEAAVLLYRLRNALNLVKKAYKSETLLATEHLNITPLAPCNTVDITDKRIIVEQGNVIKVAFASNFNSKNYAVGDEVHFYAKQDIATQEGTVIFPAGTTFLANIESLQDPRWLNKNARMTIAFKSATLPSGKTVQIQANAFENDGVLVSNHWQKPLLWTVGGTVVGTGIGLAAGVPNDNTVIGLAVGVPTGAAVGAGIGFLTPGVNFGATAGDQIFVIIREAFSIYTVSPDDNS